MSIVGKKYISDTFDFEKNIVKKTGSGSTRGIYSAQPWGADWFQTAPTTQTGAIKIAIGGTGTGLDDMLQFTVDIYDYASREMVTVRVGGYIYQAIGVGNNTWTNESAIVIANQATQNYTVRFGDDGTNHCVWIGEVNSTWTHPQVLVRNFSAGYEVPDNDVYTSEWSVSFVTAFTTVDGILTNNFPLSSGGTSGGFLPLSAGPSYPLTGDLYQTMGAIGVAQTDQDYLAKIYESNADGFMSLYTGQPTPLERIRISSYGDSFFVPANNGNVGIGTTSPDSLLTVSGSSLQNSNNAGIELSNSHNAQTVLLIENTTSRKYEVAVGGSANSIGNGSFYIYDGTAGDARLVIDSSGNVGIGTTSPDEKLDITGGYLKFNGGDYGIKGSASLTYNPVSDHYFMSSGSTKVTIKASGFVGIGTESPGESLEILKDGGAIIKLHDPGNNSWKIKADSNFHIYDDSNSDYLTILNSGNVGIGTTGPSQKLHLQNGVLLVDSNTPAATGIWMPDTNGNPSLRIVTDQSAANYSSIVNAWGNSSNTGVMVGSTRNDGFAFQVRSGVTLTDGFANDTGNSRMVVLGNGNVGIGTTSPDAKLSIKRASNAINTEISFIDGGGTRAAVIGMEGATTNDMLLSTLGGIRFYTTSNVAVGSVPSNERMRITSTGNVGIGTTNPTANLHISDTADAVLKIEGDTINSDETKGPKILLITDNGYRTAAITGGNATYETSSGNFNALNLQSKDIRFHTGTAQDYDLAVERMRITGTGALSFGTTGTAYGTSGQILKSNGNASPTWVAASTVIGGPYLPLSAGSSYPLTGDLYTGTNAINTRRLNINSFSPAAGLVMNYGNATGTVEFISLQSNGVTAPIKLQMRQSPNESDLILAGSSGTGLTLTSASNALFAGNVGIGTTSPQQLLHINNTSGDFGAEAVLRGSTSAGTPKSEVAFKRGTSGDGAEMILRTSNSSGTIQDVMTLDTAGNVGIGTDSPGSRRLSVVKDTSITAGFNDITEFLDTTLGGGGSVSLNIGKANSSKNLGKMAFKYVSSGSNSNALNFGFYDADNLMTLQAGGNVGIGTTSPAVKLEIQDSTHTTMKIRSGNNDNILFLQAIQSDEARIGTDTNSAISFFTNTSRRMTITTSGNVGIGTISPGSKLQVAGEIRAADGNKGAPSYTFTSDTNTGMYSDTADVIDFTAGGTKSLSVTTSGATVYGSALMPSNAAILLQNQNNNNQFYIRNSGVSDATFQVGQGAPGSNVRFFINGSGNVGIGNTASTASVKLEVTGNTLLKNSNGVGDLYLGNYATANHFRFHTNNANTYFDMNCGDIYWRQGTSTRYQFFPSTANMTVQGTITQNSDVRIKENVVEISDCISKVQAMRGVYYNRTDFNTEVTKVGVIAQEVEAVLPELVLESPETGLKSVAYSELTSVLINAIKEQQEIIEDLKTRITKLEN